MTDEAANKAQLRRQLRERRRQLDAGQRRVAEAAINRAVVKQLADLPSPLTIATYLSHDGEPDLSEAHEKLSQRGVRLALPVVSAESGIMQFRLWKQEEPLMPNRYGIPEPGKSPVVTPKELDCILMPLVGFDETGQRLGMGGGYYDRWLAEGAGRHGPERIGVAFACQKSKILPVEAWDQPLDHIITENGIYHCHPEHPLRKPSENTEE